MLSRKGQLILAGPDLVDPNFHQTVTLLIEHTEDGALGLTLNRPTNLTVRQVWEQLDAVTTPCHFTGRVHLGGPCEGPMMVLHTRSDYSQIDVGAGIHFTADPDHIRWLLEYNTEPMKCFATHSGWAPGQLELEVEHESWIALPATKAEVFEGGQRQWLDLIRRVNPTQAALVTNPSLLESDPSLN